nr:unnamed protein product [Callosobruchus analis]
MYRERLIAIWLPYRRRRRRLQKKRQRVDWVHPVVQKRLLVGAFYTLFQELLQHEQKFFDYFRMSIASFHELNHKLKGVLQRQDTTMRDCIEPKQMLAVAIRYLARGCTFTDLHYTYRLGLATISNIVREACLAIWNVLTLEGLLVPTKQRWEDIASCAVDGKHIRIVNPVGPMYYNYKGYLSAVLMAIADSDYRFIYVNVGCYLIFKNCSLWKSILNGEQELPDAKFSQGMSNKKVPYCFVGDEAFALHQHLLQPFGAHNLNISKRIFSYRLSRARRVVECTFGILTNKWRIFHRAKNLKSDSAVDIVKACVVLHNFVRERDGYKIEDTFSVTGLADLPGADVVREGTAANDVRNIFADYFMSEVGSVSWKTSKI